MKFKVKALKEVMFDVEADDLLDAVNVTLNDLDVVEVLRISRIRAVVAEEVRDGVHTVS